MDKDGVEKILGSLAAAGADCAIRQHTQEEVDQRGHPLFWAEYKSVEFFKVLFDQFAVTHAVDLTPGSGAAASAALSAGITYEGFAANAPHKGWLDELMDCAIFGIAVESKQAAAAVGATEEHVQQIKQYFNATVKEAKRYLTADAPTNSGEDDKEDKDSSDSDA